MKLILLLASCFLFISESFGQKTYIPDDGFEEALIFVGLDNVLDDSVTTSTIDTLTFLNIEPFGVVDLTGIEDFTALKGLACVNNDIQQIDLSNNVFMEFLIFENNNVTSLDVTNCPNLKQVFGDNNNLTTIDLSQNPLLEKLDLTQNGVGTIDLSSNPALKTLILTNTSQTSIDLTNNGLLEELDLSTNQLTALNLTNAPNLKTLIINGNSLNQIDLSSNPNLEFLLVAQNDLIDLDFQNNPLLTFMSCGYNKLETVTLPPVDVNSTANFGALYNPDLFCVQSDNAAYVNANWNLVIESFTYISDDCAAGINELKNTVEIFPNPTLNGWITANSESTGSYQLFNLNGAELQSGKINQSTNLLDFSSFTRGMYLLRLNLNNEFITRRIEVL